MVQTGPSQRPWWLCGQPGTSEDVSTGWKRGQQPLPLGASQHVLSCPAAGFRGSRLSCLVWVAGPRTPVQYPHGNPLSRLGSACPQAAWRAGWLHTWALPPDSRPVGHAGDGLQTRGHVCPWPQSQQAGQAVASRLAPRPAACPVQPVCRRTHWVTRHVPFGTCCQWACDSP